jgi:hypothetical protein
VKKHSPDCGKKAKPGVTADNKRVYLHPEAYIDLDDIWKFNFPDCAAICRSVADIDGKYIGERSRIGDQQVDVLFGGAPC